MLIYLALRRTETSPLTLDLTLTSRPRVDQDVIYRPHQDTATASVAVTVSDLAISRTNGAGCKQGSAEIVEKRDTICSFPSTLTAWADNWTVLALLLLPI